MQKQDSPQMPYRTTTEKLMRMLYRCEQKNQTHEILFRRSTNFKRQSPQGHPGLFGRQITTPAYRSDALFIVVVYARPEQTIFREAHVPAVIGLLKKETSIGKYTRPPFRHRDRASRCKQGRVGLGRQLRVEVV